MKRILLLWILLVSGSCNESICPLYNLEQISSKQICTQCQSPNLHKVNDETLLITYIQQKADGNDALILRHLINDSLYTPIEIAHGKNWFVNWADIPSIVNLDKNGNRLLAHWLQMSASGTYDYDIQYSVSNDKGKSWGPPSILHDDGVKAEHGFVSMCTTPTGAFITWLDGRNTKTPFSSTSERNDDSHHDNHNHQDHLPMTLRSAWIDQNGKKSKDIEIDNRVCDCCQTDAILTKSGPVVVFRDRDENEVRDISIAKFKNGKWAIKRIHRDNWKIAGCPVNGPAVAYKNGIMAVAWYTQMNDIAKVYLSISRDDGETFSEQPILIDDVDVIGRVDVTINSRDEALVTWMRSSEQEADIYCRLYHEHIGLYPPQKLLPTSRERKSGFPILEYSGETIKMIHTKSLHEELSINLESFSYF
ncbi:MAG: hypothetical protein P1U56_05400 [Saprospiraceae bacterium]|nr:hypothetical protein [Saprospiraceae bacterium]